MNSINIYIDCYIKIILFKYFVLYFTLNLDILLTTAILLVWIKIKSKIKQLIVLWLVANQVIDVIEVQTMKLLRKEQK